MNWAEQTRNYKPPRDRVICALCGEICPGYRGKSYGAIAMHLANDCKIVGSPEAPKQVSRTEGDRQCSSCCLWKPADNYSTNRTSCRWCKRSRVLFRAYGITQIGFDSLLKSQRGGCACCGTTTDKLKKNMSVDHCHETGEIRGILCSSCNRGIGFLGDTVSGLERALSYLRGEL
jgi:hypothetical protein